MACSWDRMYYVTSPTRGGGDHLSSLLKAGKDPRAQGNAELTSSVDSAGPPLRYSRNLRGVQHSLTVAHTKESYAYSE